MIAAFVLLNPELAFHTLFQLHDVLKLVNQLRLISVIDLFYLPISASFALVPFYSTIKTVLFVAQNTAEPALVFLKCKLAPRRWAPGHIFAAIYDFSHRQMLPKSEHLFSHDLPQVLFKDDLLALFVWTGKLNQAFFDLLIQVLIQTTFVEDTFAAF